MAILIILFLWNKELFMKNRKIFLAALALTLVLGIMACATTGDSASVSTSGEETIVCLGDSITAGYSATVPGKEDKSKSWPAFLQKKVNIPVINAGVSGDTAAKGLARVKKDVLSKNPRIVIIELGGNDDMQKIPLATTKNNLQKIIDMVNDGRRKIYICKFYPWTDEQYEKTYIMLKTLASSNNIELIEGIYDGVWGIHMGDPGHPNAKGYELMAEHFFNALNPYLEANNLLKE
jgi:acyl-CoA thioesterase I